MASKRCQKCCSVGAMGARHAQEEPALPDKRVIPCPNSGRPPHVTHRASNRTQQPTQPSSSRCSREGDGGHLSRRQQPHRPEHLELLAKPLRQQVPGRLQPNLLVCGGRKQASKQVQRQQGRGRVGSGERLLSPIEPRLPVACAGRPAGHTCRLMRGKRQLTHRPHRQLTRT